MVSVYICKFLWKFLKNSSFTPSNQYTAMTKLFLPKKKASN